MKRFSFLLLWICMVITTDARTFDDIFENRTLRLDYIFAGDSQRQEIYFEQAFVTPQWAGRRTRLEEAPLGGNGQIMLRRHGTDEVLYVHTFSTLFQEWLATEEARQVRRAFQTSYNMPFPRERVDVTVTLTDFHHRTVAQIRHTIDPHDILIRPLGDNGLHYRYVWKGGDGTDGRLTTTDTLPDIKSCIDLAILAEGYTEEQMGKFYTDCQRVVDALFSHEPFQSMKDRFNVVAVASPSLDSGASVPHEGRWSRTPVGTHYDTFYSDRYLMSQQMHRIYDLLSGVPFEHVIVLVNSATYGGGGIYNQIMVSTSDHSTFRQVFVHEFGHAYAGLGDEYAYGNDAESMYPSDTEPWEQNLTTLVDFASKWKDMLPKDTPIPTPQVTLPDYRNIRTQEERQQLNAATQRVGVFEGGGYQTHGVFRPAQECRMKINEVEDFCPVCTRAIRRITDFYTGR